MEDIEKVNGANGHSGDKLEGGKACETIIQASSAARASDTKVFE